MCWISVKILLGIKKLDVLELIQRITVHVIAGIYIKVHVAVVVLPNVIMYKDEIQE